MDQSDYGVPVLARGVVVDVALSIVQRAVANGSLEDGVGVVNDGEGSGIGVAVPFAGYLTITGTLGDGEHVGNVVGDVLFHVVRVGDGDPPPGDVVLGAVLDRARGGVGDAGILRFA